MISSYVLDGFFAGLGGFHIGWPRHLQAARTKRTGQASGPRPFHRRGRQEGSLNQSAPKRKGERPPNRALPLQAPLCRKRLAFGQV